MYVQNRREEKKIQVAFGYRQFFAYVYQLVSHRSMSTNEEKNSRSYICFESHGKDHEIDLALNR